MARTFTLECGPGCSFGPETKWGLRVSSAILDGKTYREIVQMAKDEGDVIHSGTISRHRRHIIVMGAGSPLSGASGLQHKANNIEILETIIQKGFQNHSNWKPTISDTMKAMDMWFRLTQGNPFDELLNTLAAASLGETEVVESNPQAIHAVGEQVEVDEEMDEEELVATGG